MCAAAASLMPAGLPHKRPFLCRGGGRGWSDGQRGGGQRGSQPPASSLLRTRPEVIMVFRETLRPLSSCCSLRLNLSISPSTRPRPSHKHSPLSQFSAPLQSPSSSRCPPPLPPVLHSNRFILFSPANNLFHSYVHAALGRSSWRRGNQASHA